MNCSKPPVVTGWLLAIVVAAGCESSASSENGAPARKELARTSPPDVPAPASNSGAAQSAKGQKPSPVTDNGAAASQTAAGPRVENTRVRPRLAVRAGGFRDITFDDLEFKIERDAKFDRSMLTPKIEAMEGKTVIIRGFMLAASVFQQTGIKQFVLVRDNQQCCFGPGAYLFHNIQIEMAEGKTAAFNIRPVTVEGVFAIKPWIGPDGKCYSVYHMTAQSVK